MRFPFTVTESAKSGASPGFASRLTATRMPSKNPVMLLSFTTTSVSLCPAHTIP